MNPDAYIWALQTELVSMVLFDVGAELDLDRVVALHGQEPKRAPLVARSPLPPYAGFTSPLEAVVPVSAELEPVAPGSAPRLVPAVLELRVHAVGVVAIRIRVAIEDEPLEMLARVSARLRVGGKNLVAAATEAYGTLRPDLEPARLKAYDADVTPESYLVFCFPGKTDSAKRVMSDRTALGALLMGDVVPDRMSDALVEHTLRSPLQYDRDDLVIVGPETSVVVSPHEAYEDVLDVLEFSNLVLLELRTYDAYLDRRLDTAFHTLGKLWSPGAVFRSARPVLVDLSELRLEFARLTENLRDTGKMFGDWYLGRLHRIASERFHLEEWARTVDAKIKTLNDILQLATEAVDHRRAVVLESMIVLLFILDLVLLFVVAD